MGWSVRSSLRLTGSSGTGSRYMNSKGLFLVGDDCGNILLSGRRTRLLAPGNSIGRLMLKYQSTKMLPWTGTYCEPARTMVWYSKASPTCEGAYNLVFPFFPKFTVVGNHLCNISDNVLRVTGFVKKSSIPTERQRLLASLVLFAVNAIIFISELFNFVRM